MSDAYELSVGDVVRTKTIAKMLDSAGSKANFRALKGHHFVIFVIGINQDHQPQGAEKMLDELGWTRKKK